MPGVRHGILFVLPYYPTYLSKTTSNKAVERLNRSCSWADSPIFAKSTDIDILTARWRASARTYSTDECVYALSIGPPVNAWLETRYWKPLKTTADPQRSRFVLQTLERARRRTREVGACQKSEAGHGRKQLGCPVGVFNGAWGTKPLVGVGS